MSIRHAILGILRAGPMHGYQVAAELERRTGGLSYSSAQIYQTLHLLAERGFVVSTRREGAFGRERRPFDVTPEGRREFEKWLRVPPVLSRPVRDDAVVKLAFLGAENPAQLVGFLERLRRQHLRRLTAHPRFVGVEAKGIDERLLAELAGAALRFREEAELRWIEHCLLRLRPLLPAGDAVAVSSDDREGRCTRRAVAPNACGGRDPTGDA
jgi:DNA-binding PadR family transcriptional regulator